MQSEELSELLNEYFALGVAEGKEGRNHDTLAGDAQRVRSAIEAALSAAPAVEPEGARVKPLEFWTEPFSPGYHRASSAVGRYMITEYKGMTFPFKLEGTEHHLSEQFLTLAEAKARAQEDFEARILSALQPSAAAPAPRWMTDELTRIRDEMHGNHPHYSQWLREFADRCLQHFSTVPASEAVPAAWLCNRKGEGHEEPRVTTDQELAAYREQSQKWIVEPLFAAPPLPKEDALQAQINAAREFVKRHPALSLIDLAEFEAFLRMPAAVDAVLQSEGDKP